MRPKKNKTKALAAIILLIALLLPILSGCSSNNENVFFGTDCSFELKGGGAVKRASQIEKRLTELENALSTAVETSDVYKINSAAINVPVSVGKDFAALYEMSTAIYGLYPAFNPFVFPLVELWKFDPAGFTHSPDSIPSADEITALLGLCRSDSFRYDSAESTITKLREGAKLDFGAIAKGYAADIAATVAEDTEYIINIGGTIKTDKKIRVSVTSPRKSGYAAAVTLENAAVATSGDYERYYVYEGKRYHHIIGGDGYPAGMGEAEPIISVTVTGPEAAYCDAFSTLVFIEGANCTELLTSRGYSALILTENTYKIIGDRVFEIIEQRVGA